MTTKSWETIIGLEVHIQLDTKSKLFSGAPTKFGSPANSQACALDLGIPGTLPKPNAKALEFAIKLGLSIGATIANKTVFARKNYFYPDLPKGYQISQRDLPIVTNGHLELELDDGTYKTINITRAHLEEDAGKLMHDNQEGMSTIDFNRAGIPLLEIVTAPDIRSAKEAVLYLKTLHKLVRYLDISNANMQEGSFRCDANISVRPKGQSTLNPRTEIKNLNSFRFIERAINYEANRQIKLSEQGEKISYETRFYDTAKNVTGALRQKMEEIDYRYFPDPDLLPIYIHDEDKKTIARNLSELPWQKYARFQREYSLNKYDATILTSSKELGNYFETVVKTTHASPKFVANWINGELLATLNTRNIGIAQCPINPEQFAELMELIHNNSISTKTAKEVFSAMVNGEGNAAKIVADKNLLPITDENELAKIITSVLAEHPQQVTEYTSGKMQVLDFLVGKIMQKTQGKANPHDVHLLLKSIINCF